MEQDKKKDSQGFTLLDLMMAIALVGLLTIIALPTYNGAVQKARIDAAIGDMHRFEGDIERFYGNNNGTLPPNLAAMGVDTLNDPWGNPYQYLNIEAGVPQGAVRKDRNLVPLNTDYDLYSMGKDGLSRPPLTAKMSQDDIVRAGNGSFLGLATAY